MFGPVFGLLAPAVAPAEGFSLAESEMDAAGKACPGGRANLACLTRQGNPCRAKQVWQAKQAFPGATKQLAAPSETI